MDTQDEYNIDRYMRAMHAVQSGVLIEQARGSDDGSPKHLRVGVNSALIANAAISRLLVEKGLVTEAELYAANADEAEREQARYEQRLGVKLG